MDKTLADLAEQFDVHSDQIADWKTRLQVGAVSVFGEDKAEQQAKICELVLANDFFESAVVKAALLGAKR